MLLQGRVCFDGGLEHVVVWTAGTGQKAFVDVGAAIDTPCVTESGTRAAAGLATDAIAVVAAATRRVLCRVSGVLGAGGVKCCAAAPGGLLALHGRSQTLQSTTLDGPVRRACGRCPGELLGGRWTGGRLATRSCGTLRTRTAVRGLLRTTSVRRAGTVRRTSGSSGVGVTGGTRRS